MAPERAVEQVVDSLRAEDGIASVAEPVLNEAEDTAVITAVPTTSPTSTETKDLVKEIRSAAAGVEADTGADIAVTGNTALNIDISDAMADALLPYLSVVIGLAFVLLMVVFRSILVPLKAALGFLLSVGAAFGTLVAVFQWGWGADLIGIDQTGPVMITRLRRVVWPRSSGSSKCGYGVIGSLRSSRRRLRSGSGRTARPWPGRGHWHPRGAAPSR